ncbi:Ger(x)C family spore germination protein [Paenibacillus aurantius]|uniref:Ger(X)C family spore germination protein n=1 Tax=Paenibacillus aurantius TaxID=2918900 RepID=A0AA96LDW9_9BACL|nr:Ger(x)C family spore germination protein [Paenibacillus aurantius]WNQ11901.1 Ger(x)C family spore germination protein [Paenibacillus aurantius]
MKASKRLFLLLSSLCLLLLTGCWDETHPQDVVYVTALGIDYDGKAFRIFTQVMDFSSVAKMGEGGKPNQEVPAWIGTAQGESVQQALNNLELSTQQVTSLEHLMTVICTDKALPRLDSILDAINRIRAVRYTTWVYATRIPIEKLLTVKGFFNLSPLSTLLYQPEESYRQSSFIPPREMMRFVSRYREPAGSAYLPSITLTRSHWRKQDKKETVYTLDGAYFLQHGKPAGYFSRNELRGFRWLTPEFKSSPLHLKKENHRLAEMMITGMKAQYKVEVSGGKPRYSLYLKATGRVDEIDPGVSEQDVVEEVRSQIVSQIRDTYRIGAERGVDVLNLEEKLYRSNNKLWKQVTSSGPYSPKAEELGEIRVDVHILHYGRFKLVP